MTYLTLFWTFFKIGLFTIGGGYAMIPLINAEVISHGWLTEAQLIDFIAISESTPGAFAINIATFVGTTAGGFFGAICTTLGVIAPSLLIIFLIATFFRRLTDKTVVKDAFFGLRPAVVGLIGYAFLSLTAQVIFHGATVTDPQSFADVDFWAVGLFVFLFVLSKMRFRMPVLKQKYPQVREYKRVKIHPILLILVSAALGILVYGVILQ
ncbi:MAG: chromate transporter [Clostridia bacterium]|nr:chromate transporter [Clostridia bacterium]